MNVAFQIPHERWLTNRMATAKTDMSVAELCRHWIRRHHVGEPDETPDGREAMQLPHDAAPLRTLKGPPMPAARSHTSCDPRKFRRKFQGIPAHLSLRIARDRKAKIERAAKRQGCEVSELIRQWIDPQIDALPDDA